MYGYSTAIKFFKKERIGLPEKKRQRRELWAESWKLTRTTPGKWAGSRQNGKDAGEGLRVETAHCPGPTWSRSAELGLRQELYGPKRIAGPTHNQWASHSPLPPGPPPTQATLPSLMPFCLRHCVWNNLLPEFHNGCLVLKHPYNSFPFPLQF